ncbi:hypothetical protein ACHAXT_010767 [Thalassiosira profunda]
MHRDDAIHQHGFPWDFCFPGEETQSWITGILVRKVKWMRQGELKAVRGKRQANWLAECQTRWLAKIGVKTEEHKREAVKKMKSKKFFEATHTIDNSWSMG